MIKIAVIGPESTGKTRLTEQLAAHFQAMWEPELARGYVEKLGGNYTFEDVCEIAKRQINIEKRYEPNNMASEIIFFDTDLIITKVWFKYKYNVVPDFVTERLNKKFIDFYLLCEPDIAWEPDPVREHGNDRDFFFEWYKREIECLNTPYAIINGLNEERFHNALKAINTYDYPQLTHE